jgi:hypothetical protein
MTAVRVSVEEASVNKNRYSFVRKKEIWLARNVPPVECPAPDRESCQYRSQPQFGASIA